MRSLLRKMLDSITLAIAFASSPGRTSHGDPTAAATFRPFNSGK